MAAVPLLRRNARPVVTLARPSPEAEAQLLRPSRARTQGLLDAKPAITLLRRNVGVAASLASTVRPRHAGPATPASNDTAIVRVDRPVAGKVSRGLCLNTIARPSSRRPLAAVGRPCVRRSRLGPRPTKNVACRAALTRQSSAVLARPNDEGVTQRGRPRPMSAAVVALRRRPSPLPLVAPRP